MGTRNLTMVIHKEETKIAQYGQWDGYPEGQGVTILTFLRNKSRVKKLTNSLKKVRFETKEDQQKAQEFMNNIGCPDGWMTSEKAALYHDAYPYASRDIGGEILEMVANSKDKEIVLQDSTSFAGESLFCEWAYVVDLDKRKLEVYTGFNTEPLASDERFANIPKIEVASEYTPIRCIHKFDLDNLPTKKQFLEELREKVEA
jgi:hypothetical protein